MIGLAQAFEQREAVLSGQAQVQDQQAVGAGLQGQFKFMWISPISG